MADEYPAAAYWLLLIGGILELIGYSVVAFWYAALMSMAGPMALMAGVGLGCIGWFVIMAILMIISAMWVKSGDPSKVHKGGVVGLIASILGGFNIIALIGAILALGWSKKSPAVAPPPPPPPA